MKKSHLTLGIFFLTTLFLATIITSSFCAADSLRRWLEQTVYVPLYSHIYAGERYKNKPFNLTGTLSVRNTDPDNPLTLLSVNYYDSHGKLLQAYIDKPITIAPLASTRYIVQESESAGGSGAKFLVQWKAGKAVTDPIIESVMIGTKMQQGISFISRGRVIKGTTGK